MKTYHTTVEIRGYETPITVTYLAHKGRPGRTYGPPEDCYEAEPAYIEINTITNVGTNIEELLSDAQIATITEEIEESERDAEIADQQDYYDMKRKDARYPEYWEKYE